MTKSKEFDKIMSRAKDGTVFFGDWHVDLTFAVGALERAIEKYPDMNVFYHVGDFGLWPGGEEYINTVKSIMDSVDKTLVVTGGNHEDWDQWDKLTKNQTEPYVYKGNGLVLLPKVWKWEHSGTTFVSVGGASSIDRAWRNPRTSWWPQEGISAGAVAEVGERKLKANVLITHEASNDPVLPVRQILGNPFLQMKWPYDDIVESEVQRQRVSQVIDVVNPNLHVHGHWHIPYTRTRDDLTTVSLGANYASYAENTYVLEKIDFPS